LVDASSGDHLWAEHYDRPLKDIFSLQDEIVKKIVTTLKLRIPLEAQYNGIVAGQHTDNPEAYDDYLRGMDYGTGFSAEGTSKARGMFEKAIELDPAYTDAYATLGYNYFWSWYSQYGGDDPHTLDQAIELEQRAIAIDDTHAWAHAFLCRLYPFKRQYDQAVTECRRALELNPNLANSYFWLSETFVRTGRPAEAIGFIEKTERLDPRLRTAWEGGRGEAYIVMGRYADAIPVFNEYFAWNPHIVWTRVWLTVAYSELGRDRDARDQAAEILRNSPNFSLRAEKERMAIQDEALADRYLADLRKAGLK
jgi:adenylate cyclase